MPRLGHRLAAAAVCLGVAVSVLSGCSSSNRDGDDVAAAEARSAAADISDRLGHLDRVRPVEYFVDVLFGTAGGLADPSRFEPVAWGGRLDDSQLATIDVRIIQHVDAQSAQSLFGPSHGPGDAVACFRYTLQLYRYTTYDSIACTDDAAPPLPGPTRIDVLPADAEQRLTEALTGADEASVDRLVREAFPEVFVTVETTAADGDLVAAAGVPEERDCVVVVRHAGGVIERVSFDRIWLEPGELGCSVELYTSPPL